MSEMQRTTIYVPIPLWKRFAEAAKSHRRSCSNMLVMLMEEFCAKPNTLITNSGLGVGAAEIISVTPMRFGKPQLQEEQGEEPAFGLAEPEVFRRELPTPEKSFDLPKPEVIQSAEQSIDPFALPNEPVKKKNG